MAEPNFCPYCGDRSGALAAATDAYQRLLRARREIARIEGYRHLSKSMRTDLIDWQARQNQAEADLKAALTPKENPPCPAS